MESNIAKVYNKLTVIKEYATRKTNNAVVWKFDCVCECGEFFTSSKFNIQHNVAKSCKTCRYDKPYTGAFVGDIFGKLTLLELPKPPLGGTRMGKFLCECGNEKMIAISSVRAKFETTVSCGCHKLMMSKRLGIGEKLDRKHWSEICERYRNLETSTSIADCFGVSNDTICRILHLSDEKLIAKTDRGLRKDVVLDRTRFTDYSCPDTAYYYGLLLADGCLTGRTGNALLFSLKSTDGYMVDNFHKWMNASTKLSDRDSKDKRTGKTYYARCMRVTDHVIAANLRKLGFEERKSTREKLPEVYRFNRDFWRGMVDGDGCITKDWITSLCGSEEICRGFSDYAVYLGASKPLTVYNVKGLWIANTTNKFDSKIVLDALYNNSNIHLIRKYELYLSKYVTPK